LPYYTKKVEILQQVQRNNAASNYDSDNKREQHDTLDESFVHAIALRVRVPGSTSS